jgi:hypothetical protein
LYVRETNVSTRKKGAVTPTETTSKRPERLGLRLPAGMTERMKRAAEADARNVTSWVEKLIRDALDQSERKH